VQALPEAALSCARRMRMGVVVRLGGWAFLPAIASSVKTRAFGLGRVVKAIVCGNSACVGSMAVCVALACLVAPGQAVGAMSNVASTHAYLRASAAFARSASADVTARTAAGEASGSEIAGGCPLTLRYAPRDDAFEELGSELALVEWYSTAVPLWPAFGQMAGTISHLRWSDRELTKLVQEEAAEERADVGLVLPDVCGDIEAWKASAYARLPQDTEAFIAHIKRIEAHSTVDHGEHAGQWRERVISRLLRRYESPLERRAAARIERLERQAGKRVAVAVENDDSELATALGVSEL
jgi:hypothetical protein